MEQRIIVNGVEVTFDENVQIEITAHDGKSAITVKSRETPNPGVWPIYPLYPQPYGPWQPNITWCGGISSPYTTVTCTSSASISNAADVLSPLQ